MKAGFIGLGQIGLPMAQRLAAGFEVVAYDVRPEVSVDGATRASGLADFAECDVVCLMVRDDAQVNEVADGLLEVLAPGSVIVVHSTIHVSTAAALAQRAGAVGVLDAPVSGGFMGAADGTLAIMVGGDKAAYSTAKPVLKQMGTLVMHLGEIGSGTKAKLARNLLHFISFAAVTEAQRVAEASGIDLVKLGQIVRHSDAVTGGPGAIMHRDRTGPLAEDDFWHGVFAHVWALGDKDLTLAMELAASEGIDTPLAKLAHQILPIGLGLEEAHE